MALRRLRVSNDASVVRSWGTAGKNPNGIELWRLFCAYQYSILFPWGISESQSKHPMVDLLLGLTQVNLCWTSVCLNFNWYSFESKSNMTAAALTLCSSSSLPSTDSTISESTSMGTALSWMYTDNIAINSVARFSFANIFIWVLISGLACRKGDRLSLAEFTGKTNFEHFWK